MEGRLTLSNRSLPDSLPAHTTVSIKHRVGSVALNVNFSLTQQWTVLFGPSGCGKTTVLRTIAGFVRPGAGQIKYGEDVLLDSAAKIFLPAYRRPVRGAGQTARLFPNMSVRRNAMYGTGWSSRPDDVMQMAEEVIGLFRLGNLIDRMPRDLSGGERQRACVARAIVSAVTFDGPGKPLLLLDEPFSGLDAVLRDDLLRALREWLVQWQIPVLSVTHDVGEAFQLGAEVIKIADGRVVQRGQADEVLAEERRRLLEQLNAVKESPA
jgi:molybdate transport system ATP-binding protein